MSIINNTLLLGSGDEGYNLTRSLRFRASAGGHLSKTFSAAGDQKTFTISKWLKRGALGIDATFFASVTDANNFLLIYYQASTDKIIILGYSGGSAVINISTSAVFRDPSAWYHLVFAFDTTQATGSNRVKLYVNNTQQSVTFTNTPSLNLNALPSTTRYIGRAETAANYFDGYLTEVNFIDGQALTPSSFGETDLITGVWKPKRYAGTYGTNGFYLPFTDNSALTTSSNVGLGKDFSGNGNYWTTNNISITSGVTYDSMTDVPTLTSATAANYCVVNPLNQVGATIAGGNLNITFTAGTSGATATFGMPSGKWYWETTIQQIGSSCGIGIVNDAGAGQLGSGSGYGQGANSWVYREDGNKRTNSSSSAYGASYTTGDVIGVAFDADADTLTFYKNGTSQGTAFTGLTATTYYPVFGASIAVNNIQNVNFGQRPFAYTPPSGFVALNTYNLPTSTIVKGNTVMDATLYSGDSSATQTITNSAGFKPDLVWLKSRSSVDGWAQVDSVRGANKLLQSNNTNAESTTGSVTAFNSNGFSADLNFNVSGRTYVGWQWQAGQGTTSSNTSGTITSTVSVNASAGFSILTFSGNGTSGATVGHGLGVAPNLVIVRRRETPPSVPEWIVYHSSIGNTGALVLNQTVGTQTGSFFWNNTSPSSSVFTVGNDVNVNNSGNTYVAYCFAAIPGFSAFGSYTGNGSTDGPFVYTGFRPKFILIKRTDSSGYQWAIWDSIRNTYNAAGTNLWPDSSEAEATSTSYDIDMLSNGFKFRTNSTSRNGSGGTHIYMAFAENPFKNALAR
jgi:hypothetical protein